MSGDLGDLGDVTSLQIILDGDGAFNDVEIGADGALTRITLLEGGMQSGSPSVGLLIDIGDGQLVFAQTSLKLLISAAKAFEARHPGIMS